MLGLLSYLNNEKNSETQLECGPMPNVMVALPNIGGSPAVKAPILSEACIRVRIKYFYSFMTFGPY